MKKSQPLKKPKLESPIKRFWKRVKRIMLLCSAMLFFGFLYAAYSEIAPMFDTNAGKAFSWGAGATLGPLVGALPWWVWCGAIGIIIYLWLSHKWLMSAVYGVLIGVLLAVS